jgi:pyruvate/2-oxoglutarate dehydrogenase complex dihydrolipoamide acyltransferase (E2) component
LGGVCPSSPITPVPFIGDHRVIDGATGAKFLQTLRGFVEEPLTFVL